MELNYQCVLELITSCMALAFPIALVFMITQKVVGIFVSFVFGKEVDF